MQLKYQLRSSHSIAESISKRSSMRPRVEKKLVIPVELWNKEVYSGVGTNCIFWILMTRLPLLDLGGMVMVAYVATWLWNGQLALRSGGLIGATSTFINAQVKSYCVYYNYRRHVGIISICIVTNYSCQNPVSNSQYRKVAYFLICCTANHIQATCK